MQGHQEVFVCQFQRFISSKPLQRTSTEQRASTPRTSRAVSVVSNEGSCRLAFVDGGKRELAKPCDGRPWGWTAETMMLCVTWLRAAPSAGSSSHFDKP